MIKFWHHIFLLLLLIGACQEPELPDPGDTFLKYYGEKGSQEGAGMIYLEATGETILFGEQTKAQGSHSDVFMMKVDQNGNEVLSVSRDFTNPAYVSSVADLHSDEIGSISLEGSLLLYVGTSTNPDRQLLAWAVLDLDFNVVQEGWIEEPDGYVKGKAIVWDDGELVIIGESNVIQEGDPIVTNGGQEQQIYLARVNPSDPDSILVRRTRGFAGTDEILYADKFEEDNFIIIGSTEQNAATQGSNVLIMALNDILIPRVSEQAPIVVGSETGFNDRPFDVYKRRNGYVITGTSSLGSTEFPFFVNVSYSVSGSITVDAADTLQVQAHEQGQGRGLGVTLGPNGNYFIVGSVETGSKAREILIQQTDQAGEGLPGLERSYGLTSGDDAGNDIVVAQDGSLLVLSTVDFGGSDTLLGLMKLNTDGELKK